MHPMLGEKIVWQWRESYRRGEGGRVADRTTTFRCAVRSIVLQTLFNGHNLCNSKTCFSFFSLALTMPINHPNIIASKPCFFKFSGLFGCGNYHW